MSKKPADSRSIAGRIASHWQLKKLWIYISTDIAFAAAAVIVWCAATELHISGKVCAPDIYRGFRFSYDEAAGMLESLKTAVYYFDDYSADAGWYVYMGLVLLMCIASAQAAFWLISCITEYFRAKKMLRPLNQMAITASNLTEKAHQSSYSFDDIESAIGRIDPMTDVHISTGNRDLKRLESAINDMLDRMRAAYNSQARFVSDAAHELRTPIAVIKGYANMLDRWGKTDVKVLEEGIEAIKNESESMNKLVEQLLFLARGDNGKQQLTMTEFSLSDMISEVFSEQEMIDPDHEYTLDVQGDIRVSGDETMLKQTARILCDNAKKYTPKGNPVTLRARLTSDKLPSFEVQDTGIGIDEKDIPKIFDRFYRSDSSRARETGGTGLGLSIAKWIVDRHGGHFEVISYKDIGTRITVVLPVTKTKIRLEKE